MNFAVRNNKLLKFVVVAFLWLYAEIALANPTVLLVSNNSHFGIVHRIEAALFVGAHPKAKIIHLVIDKLPENKEIESLYPSIDLIVTIGKDALSKVLKTQHKAPILSILTREFAFNALLKDNSPSRAQGITAIFPDQPLTRQFALIKSLSPLFSQKSIGILLGANSLQDQESLQSLALEFQLKLSILHVNKDENPVAVLDSLLNDVKVVLALPDHQLYNSYNARGMFLTAFHKRVPLIGYSSSFVNNGALAAIYCDNKQMAAQTAQKIVEILESKDKGLPPCEYPKEFSLSINHQVANIMKLKLAKEEDIIKAIKQLELDDERVEHAA